jgi:hypothetical protein
MTVIKKKRGKDGQKRTSFSIASLSDMQADILRLTDIGNFLNFIIYPVIFTEYLSVMTYFRRDGFH